MRELNYQHLRYFWTVAREGSIARASRVLLLTQPTISMQIKALERALGTPLFARAGRGLSLTDAGRVALRYAEEIFGLGRELGQVLAAGEAGRAAPLVVGAADALPKLVVLRLLEPALALDVPPRLVVLEDRVERLLGALALHELDVVLADQPIPAGHRVRAYSRLLGESGVAFYAAPRLAARLRPAFPGSLTGAPLLLPAEGTATRRAIDAWLGERTLRPRVIAELQDSALAKVMGASGLGCFVAPTAISRDIERRFGARPFGVAEGVTERFYSISPERRLRNPALLAILGAARRDLFAKEGPATPTTA